MSAEKPYLIGVDLGGTNVRASLITRAGEIVQQARHPSLHEQPPAATLGQIVRAAQEAIQAQGIGVDQVLGVGIGLPGIRLIKANVTKVTPSSSGIIKSSRRMTKRAMVREPRGAQAVPSARHAPN